MNTVHSSGRSSGRAPDALRLVTLEPGAWVQAKVSFGILDCATESLPHGVDSVLTVPMTYRAFGITHGVDLDVGYAMSVEALPHCPYGR